MYLCCVCVFVRVCMCVYLWLNSICLSNGLYNKLGISVYL